MLPPVLVAMWACVPVSVAGNSSGAEKRKPDGGSRSSLIGRALAGKLVRPGDNRFVPCALEGDPKYYLVYYSAHWCGPCRRFTPKLVKFHNRMEGEGADFETVFVSFDRSEKAMLRYMREAEMPWPGLRYKERGGNVLARYAGRGIPALAVLNGKGQVILPPGGRASHPAGFLGQVESLLRRSIPSSADEPQSEGDPEGDKNQGKGAGG